MAAKTVNKVPLVAVTVFRDGKTYNVQPGEAFAFYEEEIADIKKAEKAEGRDLMRDPAKEEVAAAKAKADEI